MMQDLGHRTYASSNEPTRQPLPVMPEAQDLVVEATEAEEHDRGHKTEHGDEHDGEGSHVCEGVHDRVAVGVCGHCCW